MKTYKQLFEARSVDSYAFKKSGGTFNTSSFQKEVEKSKKEALDKVARAHIGKKYLIWDDDDELVIEIVKMEWSEGGDGKINVIFNGYDAHTGKRTVSRNDWDLMDLDFQYEVK